MNKNVYVVCWRNPFAGPDFSSHSNRTKALARMEYLKDNFCDEIVLAEVKQSYFKRSSNGQQT